MKASNIPGVEQANWIYVLMIALVYGASSLLIPVIGVGANLWINELFWLLGLVMIITWIKGYSFKDTFSIIKPKKGVLFFSAVIGLCVWFPAVFIYSVADKILTLYIGPLPAESMTHHVIQSILLVFGLIILAPLCEEFFFRGLLQKAYDGYNKKYSWLIVGVLFGVFHIGNGLSDIFSATILGVLMGYMLYVTNSIWSSVVLHAFNNLASVFLGQITLTLKDSDPVPFWFVAIMLAGIVLVLISVSIIRKKYQESYAGNRLEADHVDVTNKRQTDTKTHVRGVMHFLPLLLAAVIFVGIGVSEIRLRSNTVILQMVDSGYSKISIGKTETDASLKLIEFELCDQNTYEFERRNDFEAKYMHAIFKLIGPGGSVHHTEGPIFGKYLTVSGGRQQCTISGVGQWQLVISGELEDFEIEINWTLKRLPVEVE